MIRQQPDSSPRVPLLQPRHENPFETASVVIRFDHYASVIVHANHRVIPPPSRFFLSFSASNRTIQQFAMKESSHPRRHLWLLILLLLIFIFSPFVLPYYYGPLTLNIVAVAVLLSASYAVSNRRPFLIIGLSLSTLTIILGIIYLTQGFHLLFWSPD